jgi:hypothetical protein
MNSKKLMISLVVFILTVSVIYMFAIAVGNLNRHRLCAGPNRALYTFCIYEFNDVKPAPAPRPLPRRQLPPL